MNNEYSNVRRPETITVETHIEIEIVEPPNFQCLSIPISSQHLPSFPDPSNPATRLSMSSLPSHYTVSREYFLRERREKEQMKMEINC